MTNIIQEYIKGKEELNDLLLDFIDGGNDENFDKLQKYLQAHNIADNYSEFKLFLRLLVIISNYHNRNQFFFCKIEKILQAIKDDMKKIFTESDLFDIFYTNKRVLLFLIQNKFIEVNNIISNFDKIDNILFKSYFYPELKDSFNIKDQEKINYQISNLDQDIFNHFNELRLTGENHIYLCSLIRQDLVKEFIIYVNKNNLSLTKFLIQPSLFESNSILNDNQKVTLIEYAAFYGSIEIFQFLLLNGCELPSSLWKYVIHSRNAEMIHLLEENHVDGQDYIECVEESIKCHHNEIADYIIDNLITLDESKKKQIFSFSFKYQNFNIMNRPDINDIDYIKEEIFYNSCKFDYESIILIRIKNQENLNIDFNKAFNFCCENNAMNITQIFLDNKLIKIDKFSRCEKLKKIRIPTYINIIKESSFLSCSALSEVTIPSSVVIIEKSAFEHCESLKHVIIPSSVTRIGNNSFRKCEQLITITLPSTILLIQKTSFENCISLEKILLSDNSNNCNLIIEDGAFRNCKSLKQIPILSFCERVDSNAFSCCESLEQIIIPPSLTKLQNSVFGFCKSIKQVTIPSTIKSIENHAFCYCSSLEKVSIETSFLTKINIGTFVGCSSLIEINIPSSVGEICKLAFSNCESIKQIVIPSSVKIIGDSAFKKCKLLSQIALPSTLVIIDSKAFKKCESIKQIKIPSSCKLIGQKVFSGCINLEEIELPSLMNEIPCSMFKNCGSIKIFTIPSNVKIIDSKAFKGCSSLKELKIPSFVEEIRESAFQGCSSLKEFKIPSSVIFIGKYAFASCSSIEKIEIPSSVRKISPGTFQGCSSLKEFKIPSSVIFIGQYAFDSCSSIEKIDIPFSVERIDLYAFQGCSSLKEFKIPSSVIFIEQYAFASCSSIEQIEFPSSIREISPGVFKGCSSLKEFKIPSSVISIGQYAFASCSSIEQIEIPSSVERIDFYAFQGCTSLKQIIIPFSLTEISEGCFEGCSSLVNINLPDSIQTIESNSFSQCKSLKQINIPSSVKSIESLAFSGCLSLENIYVNSSTIEIKIGVFWGCPLLDSSKIESLVNDTELVFDSFNKLISLKQRNKLIYQLNENVIDLNDYEFVEIIDESRFAFVVKAREKKTRKNIVFKFYNHELRPAYINIYLAYALTNIDIPGIVRIQRFRHPLIQDEENYLDIDESKIFCQINTNGYIIIKDYYKNGNLNELTENYLNSKGSNNSILNPTIRSKIIFGVAAILKKLHKLKIVYSNLTFGNVLLDDNCEPLINNLEYAGFNKGGPFDELPIMMEHPYTADIILHWAPERMKYNNSILKSDVYSYGIFIYLMFSPLKTLIRNNRIKSLNQIYRMIHHGKRFKKPNNIPDHYWNLIQSCWAQEPDERPSFVEIAQLLRDDVFALEEFGNRTDLDQLHEYQNRIDNDLI